MQRSFLAFILVAITPTSYLYAQKVRLTFAATDTIFSAGAAEYREIWEKESNRIIEAMERESGLEFPEHDIIVHVYGSASNSGGPGAPMKLRGTYSKEVKLATLIHELGHRLHFALESYPDNYDDHELLFLYLYDVWVSLYGEEFATNQVLVEYKRSNPKHNYEAMWKSTLALNKEERKQRLNAFLEKHGPK